MFTSSKTVARFILNFLLSLVLFLIFCRVGWIQINPGQPPWLVFLVIFLLSMLVGFLLGIFILLISPLVVVVALITLGLGLLILGPAAQYFTLLIISNITHLFTITTIWWQAIVIGLAYNILRVNAPKNS